jgi:hypothetical protein
MTIFGKSKKRKEVTTPLPQPSTSTFYQQPNQTRHHAITSPPNWTYTEQRPSTSSGYGQSQPQGWLVMPIHQRLLPDPRNHNAPPPQPPRPQKSIGAISKLNLSSMSNLLQADVPPCIPGARILNDGLSPLQMQGTQYLNQGAALCDQIASKLNEIITLIDGERFSGHERELVVHQQPQPMWQQQQPENTNRAIGKGKSKGMVNNPVSSVLTTTNYFAKVNLYANSRLPPNLPPLKL